MSTITEKVARARAAQKKWEGARQRQIDAVVRELGKTVYDNAEELARLTVDETGIGNYEYNLKQDMRKALIIWHSLKGKRSIGVIKRDARSGIVEIAKPIGVVGAVLPVTIPVTNFMSNAMFSLKARNAVIGAPHPKARRTTARTAELFHKALDKFGAPKDLIQFVEEPSIEMTSALMKEVDVIVATGGMAMVKSAYSSGKPAYGVGPGNVQCILDRDIDFNAAVEMVVEGRIFNQGLPCACEQAVFVHREDARVVLDAFKRQGAHFIDDPAQAQALAGILYVDGVLSRDCIGKSAPEVARLAGFSVPEQTKMLLVSEAAAPGNVSLRKEKLCPVTLFYTYEKFDDAVNEACANLALEGRGHSVAIHSNNKQNIEKFAAKADVSRVIVNQCATTSAGGSFFNGFGATTTLGTGFWGNNIMNANLNYTHLMNITRVGYKPRQSRVPTDAEIWGE